MEALSALKWRLSNIVYRTMVDDAITRAEIEKRLRAVGIESAEVHVIGPSLEDVFVALTAKYANNGAAERKVA